MIAPVNNNNVNVHLQQFSLDDAVSSSDRSVPASLDDALALEPTVPDAVIGETVSVTNSINTLFDKSTAPNLLADANVEKTISAPGFITPDQGNLLLPVANEAPANKDNTTAEQLSATPPGREPAPLPPPSEVTPAPAPPPPLPSPLPSGPPPVPPADYSPNPSQNIYYNQNYIGPALSFGSSTQIGAISRFGLAKNISIRPGLFLGSSPQISVPVTYDFGLNNDEQFEKNPLIILHAGGGLSYRSVTGGNALNPLVVFGADFYFGDGASVLFQLANTFNSEFSGIVGVGLQF
jgi:hypothetical protein